MRMDWFVTWRKDRVLKLRVYVHVHINLRVVTFKFKTKDPCYTILLSSLLIAE